MARAPATPRKSSLTSGSDQTERTAKRIARQQKQLEKTLINEMTAKVAPNAGKMPKLSDLRKLTPLTDTQANLFEALENDDAEAYLLYGSAGTGKTYVCLHYALSQVLQQESIYKKIIIVRSLVASRECGFLPGDLAAKQLPYEQPYMNICADLTKNRHAYEKLKETDKLEFMNSGMLRGSTFNDCIIVVDEIQNFSWMEINTIITRVGLNTKFFCIGDSKQNDLVQKRNDVSGFKEFHEVTKLMPEFRSFKFTSDDIVRSGFCKSWIIACEKMGL